MEREGFYLDKLAKWQVLATRHSVPSRFAASLCTFELSYDFVQKIGDTLPAAEVIAKWEAWQFGCEVSRWAGNASDTEIMAALGNPYENILTIDESKLFLAGLFYDFYFLETTRLDVDHFALLYARTETGHVLTIILRWYPKTHTLLLDCSEFGGRYPFVKKGLVLSLVK